jgi:CBS domain containing-hemolysin-like protein
MLATSLIILFVITGYIYLALYNTEAWLRLNVGIFQAVWMLLKGIVRIFEGLFSFVGGFFRRR